MLDLAIGNPLLNTDSYKHSHWKQYPPGTEALQFYIESRGGTYPTTTFFGLQPILKEYLARKITKADVQEAEIICRDHGVPFNSLGWNDIVRKYGHFPVKIRAVAEGTNVPVHNALAIIESTDPEFFWVPGFVETQILRLWYPTTVATISNYIRRDIQKFLEETSDDPVNQLPFKLHDFGARGVSSFESSILGGMAHLVNFAGTDTMAALQAAKYYYKQKGVAGFSIPAAEHSTITSWGKSREADAYKNMIEQFGRKGSIFAVVSDSYDIFNAVQNIWGDQLREEVIKSEATLVVRPDSGDPKEVVLKCLDILAEKFGFTVNSKGYKVLNGVRVIQGDGVNPTSIREICDAMKAAGYSGDNIAFGMGGALLQKLDRDTQKFAMKCNAALIDGEWKEVGKSPITDMGKVSKKGRIKVLKDLGNKTWKTVPVNQPVSWADQVVDPMIPVFENGQILKEYSFDQIRRNASDY